MVWCLSGTLQELSYIGAEVLYRSGNEDEIRGIAFQSWSEMANTVIPPKPPLRALTASPCPLIPLGPEYVFPWLYMTPFTAISQYRRFFTSPESGDIGGVDCSTRPVWFQLN